MVKVEFMDIFFSQWTFSSVKLQRDAHIHQNSSKLTIISCYTKDFLKGVQVTSSQSNHLTSKRISILVCGSKTSLKGKMKVSEGRHKNQNRITFLPCKFVEMQI